MSTNSPNRPQSISHNEWLRLLDIRFPVGRNPWIDIYDAGTTSKIGAVIQVKEEDEKTLFQLRSALVQSAEMISTFSITFGDVNPQTSKSEWLRQAKSKSGNLLDHVCKEERLIPEISVSPDYLSQVHELETHLNRFISTLETLEKLGGDNPPTTVHSDYLQFVVNRLTEVFVQFRSRHEVKRSSASGVYGIYPDFIRIAAKPYLTVNYRKYRLNPERYEKLDRQIQAAVARYNLERKYGSK